MSENKKKKKVKKATASKPVKKKTASKPVKKATATKSAQKTAGSKSVKSAPATKPSQKSATLQAIERQQKLENTIPLGALTEQLPNLGLRSALDAPSRNPIRRKAAEKKIEKAKRRQREYREFNPKEHIALFVAIGFTLAAVITLVVLLTVYRVDTVIIDGNVHYTNDEIYEIVIGDSRLNHNSIYLSIKYKDKEIQDVPFIQTMSVKIVDSKTVKINVYEKAVAGFVEYMNRYFYFDKDGTVIESSNVMTKGIPQVMGLNFDHIVLYETLPIESDTIFKQILEMTQLLEKYDIAMDKIYFDKNYNMTLYFDNARIKVGDFTNIDEKIIKLKTILPELEGKKGVLRLDGYDGTGSVISFEVDK